MHLEPSNVKRTGELLHWQQGSVTDGDGVCNDGDLDVFRLGLECAQAGVNSPHARWAVQVSNKACRGNRRPLRIVRSGSLDSR